jgi:hypothetical protein
MSKTILEHIYPQLDEVGKFIKFGRKKTVSSIKDSLNEFENSHNELKSMHETLSVENADLKNSIDLLNNMISKKKMEYDQLDSTYHGLTTKHDALKTKHNLVGSLLSAKNSDNTAMKTFSSLLNNEFMLFANNESSLQEEAQAIIILQNIEKQLQRIVNFSKIHNKKMVAVGGGFSAGKSEFLNSFFEEKNIQLTVGLKPVTAIPTYITSGLKNAIKGYSYQGGIVDISTDLHKQLSHDFMKTFNFNLKDIMPIMAIETPIEEYKHICFIDTPGYNPSSTESFTDQDFSTAQEYLNHSNVLLWLIGLDSNGTFPSSDLNFINNLSLDGKKLYIVANKADLKSEEDLNDILDIFEGILEDYDIEYEGISAYSSVHKKEIFNRKISLSDFLHQEDNQVEVWKQILNELNSVFKMYKNAINEEIKWTHEIQSNFKSFELDLLQIGYDINDEIISNRFEKMRNMFDSKSLQKQLVELEKIRSLMNQSVIEIFKSLNLNTCI